MGSRQDHRGSVGYNLILDLRVSVCFCVLMLLCWSDLLNDCMSYASTLTSVMISKLLFVKLIHFLNEISENGPKYG